VIRAPKSGRRSAAGGAARGGRVPRRPPTGRFFRVQARDVRVELGFARRRPAGEGGQDAATAAAADADAAAITTTSTAADGRRRHRRRRR